MDTKEFLQGKKMVGQEPIHPALVHLPVRFVDWTPSFSTLFPSVAPLITQWFRLLSGASLAVWRRPFWPYRSASRIGGELKEKPASKLGLIHAGLNSIVAVIFLVNFFLRLSDLTIALHVTVAQLILTIVGDIVLLVSGFHRRADGL